MFLTSLKKREKIIFLNLASALIKSDGAVEESEEKMLEAYAHEMNLPVSKIEETIDVDALINELADISTERNKRIFFVELLALAFVDGRYAPEEKEIMQKMIDVFGYSIDVVQRVTDLQDAYMSSYISMVNFIKKGK